MDSAAIDVSPLFEPITIRAMRLATRVVMPAMQRSWCRDGRPSEFLGEYYSRRVRGGASLVITEACAVDHPTATQVPQYGWIRPDTADAWRRCAEAVTEAGGHLLIQLWHEGAIRAVGGDGPYGRHPTLSPSGLAGPGRPNGRAATGAELVELRDAFVRGARIAEDIGAAGVEVHACHGYLLDQFLWSATNRRTDGYGGADLRDRARFPVEIVEAIRAAVSDDFVISFRFSQWKEVDYGARVVETPDELRTLVELVEAAGADLLHVSARRFWTPEWPGSDLGIAGWTKAMTTLPVIGVGSVGLDVDVMDNLLGKEAAATGTAGLVELMRRFARGDFDLVSVGRGQIGDPEWTEKVRTGRVADIRPFTRADVIGDLEVPGLISDAHA